MREFWAQKHEEGDIRALSGNGYITIFYLHLDDIFPGAQCILNIGVGTGKFERACVQAGKKVWSMDIAPAATRVLQGVSEAFYVDIAAMPSNSFDLVTELLVAQHIDDAELGRHMRYAIRGLTKDGIYAVQSPMPIKTPTAQERKQMVTERFMQGGRVVRTNAEIEGMAAAAGGEVVGIHRVWEFPQHNMIWNAYHIRRAS